jgi:hypothetical protein
MRRFKDPDRPDRHLRWVYPAVYGVARHHSCSTWGLASRSRRRTKATSPLQDATAIYGGRGAVILQLQIRRPPRSVLADRSRSGVISEPSSCLMIYPMQSRFARCQKEQPQVEAYSPVPCSPALSDHYQDTHANDSRAQPPLLSCFAPCPRGLKLGPYLVQPIGEGENSGWLTDTCSTGAENLRKRDKEQTAKIRGPRANKTKVSQNDDRTAKSVRTTR